MKSRSVAIFSGSHLCHNPRVFKEATTLADAGYTVEVFGGWFDPKLRARDRELLPRLNFHFEPVLDLVENHGRSRFTARVKRRLGELGQQRGLENSWQLGYFGSMLRNTARSSKADLLIAHSEQAMAAISTARHANLGVDMEDWFSEDGGAAIGTPRPVRLLRSLEEKLLRQAAHSTCTSQVMSETLADRFGCRSPTVIYNTFPFSDRESIDCIYKDRKDLTLHSVHWFSQTLGRARGLEDLLRALPYLHRKVEVHLRGKLIAGFETWIEHNLPREWRSHVFIHDLVSNDELLSRIAEHDIGFSGDPPNCANREVTIPNKVFQYLLAGLAVVATDTAGHREVARQSDRALMLYSPGNSESLARCLNELLDNSERLTKAKNDALRVAADNFCWERQAPALLESVKRAFVS